VESSVIVKGIAETRPDDAADVPLLISRKVAYNVKMRAQYREWIGTWILASTPPQADLTRPGKTGMSIKGSDLQGRPKDPWTKAKSSLREPSD
jgi:hypothetical protein